MRFKGAFNCSLPLPVSPLQKVQAVTVMVQKSTGLCPRDKANSQDEFKGSFFGQNRKMNFLASVKDAPTGG